MVNFDNEPAKQPWRRHLLRAVIVLLCAFGIYGGYRLHRKYEPQRLSRQAESLFQKGDDTNALLMAQRALQLNQTNLDANRLMAKITEKAGQSESVIWWQRVGKLSPDSLQDAISLAKAALKFGIPAIADQALAPFAAANDSNPEFQEIMGDAALELNKLQDAGKHYEKAATLRPDDENYQLKRALLGLQSDDPQVKAAARTKMQELCAKKQVQTRARRALAADALARNDFKEASRISEEMQKDPGVIFADRLSYLYILSRTGSTDFDKHLLEIQAMAAGKSADAASLLSWMNANGMAVKALVWSKTLAPDVAASPNVACAAAFCNVTIRNWDELMKLVSDGHWGKLEYMRLVLLARAFKEQGQDDASRTRTSAAIALAVKLPDATPLLLKLFALWNWDTETVDLLWAVAKEPNEAVAVPALKLLSQHYFLRRDTRGLMNVSERMMAIDPASLPDANNYAMFSLLLNQDIDRAFNIAQGLYKKDPKNTGFVSTYAFALHVLGRSDEALELMNTLPEEKLREPSTAAYYGVVLVATGEMAKAAEFFELAKNAPLFPEEKKLLESAKPPTN